MQPDDQRAILDCIAAYLDGLYEGDAGKIASVFHPSGALTYEEQGQLRILPRDQWLDIVRNRTSPQAIGQPRLDDVLQIDQSAPAPPSSSSDAQCCRATSPTTCRC